MKRINKQIIKFIIIFIFVISFFMNISKQNNITASSLYSDYVTNINDASLSLKNEMINRNPSIIVMYKGSHLSTGDIETIFNNAISHNGIGNEGDYLSHNFLNSSYTYTYETIDNVSYTKIIYNINWFTTLEQETEVTLEINKVLEELNLWNSTDYEKVKGVYDYICANVKYDFENYDKEMYEDDPNMSYLHHSTYSAIILKKTVCQGYATLLYRMLLELGIDSRYITGMADNEYHAWNIVCLDGKYYNLDSTYDRSLTMYYRYFLCTNYNFANHTRDSKYDTSAFNSKYPMSEVPYGVSTEVNGSINNNIIWYIEKNGTLTIEGTGAIPDYSYNTAPWSSYVTSVSNIVISEGITTIGARAFIRMNQVLSISLPSTLQHIKTYAFDNCRSLKEINLPYGLLTIGTNAFSECSALTYVEIPDSVVSVGTSVFSTCHNIKEVKLSSGMTTIPDSMFFNMDGLKKVIIPDSITEIQDTAFCGCDGLTTFTLPAQITKIGVAVFSDCYNLGAIYVEAGSEHFSSLNGVLFDKNMTVLYCYPSCKGVTSYNVPIGVTRIAYGAFGLVRNLQEIFLPGTLEYIEGYAFNECQRLKKISLPSSVKEVGSAAFAYNKRLESIEFSNPDTILNWHTVTQCTALTSIILPSNLTHIPTGAISDCSSLTSITIPNSVVSIGDSAFSYCTSLTNINIPENVRTIGYSAFAYCSNLEVVTFNGNVTSMSRDAFDQTPKLKLIHFKGTISGINSTSFTDTTIRTVYFDNQSAVNNLTSSSAYSSLIKNAKTIGINATITSIPSYVKNNYTYVYKHKYNNVEYNLYSNHQCNWTTYNTNYLTCSTCKAVVDKHTHTYNQEVISPTCYDQGYTIYTCTICGYRYFDDYTSSLGHNFSLWYVSIEPTCTEYGEERRDCDRCDIHQTSELYPLGHDLIIYDRVEPTCTTTGLTYGEECRRCDHKIIQTEISELGHNYISVVSNPTCLDNGYTTHTCDRCSDSYVDNYVDALGHNIVIDERVEPTCTEAGLTEGEHCTRCDYKVTQDKIEALGHNYTSVVTKPTCLEKGYTTHTCERCNDSYVDNYVDALGHDIVIDEKVEPTCTETGLTEGSHCTRCDYKVEQVVVDALGHDIVVDEKVEPTCTATGLTEGEHCTRCDHKVAQEVIEVLGHSYSDEITLPTCESQGYTTHICERCNDSYFDTYVDALGHNIVVDEKVEPTCTETGLTEGEHCTRCDYKVAQDIIEALGHNYTSVVTKPTCIDKGYTTHTCERCNDTYVDSLVDALGHDIVIDAKVEPTCIETGLTEGEHCARCDYKVAQEVVEALGHNYTSVVTKPTCIDKGYTTHTCNRCNDSYVDTYVDALGHDIVIDEKVEPTCTETGLTEGSHCTRCNYKVEQVVIEVLGHNYTSVLTKPTCLEKGYTTHTCERCDDSYVDSYVDALGHDIVVDERVEPTCTEACLTEGEHCTSCDYKVEQVIIEALGHNYKSVVTLPTCTERGYTTHKCERCDDSYIDSYVDALGHDIVVDKGYDATCTETGLTEGIHCTSCDYKVDQIVIEALGHIYTSVVTKPTCLEKGYTTHTCDRCDDSYVDSLVDALGHDIVIDEKVEPTCTKTGLTEGNHCIRCDYKVDQNIINELGHKYLSEEKIPTCDKEGYTIHTCERCNDFYIDSIVNMLGHIYEEEIIQATCTLDGYTIYTCSRCNHSYKDLYINSLGHDLVIIEGYDASCTTKGLSDGAKCTRCDYEEKQFEIDALGHVESDWIIDKEATTESYGHKRTECIVCGEILIEGSINKLSSCNSLSNVYEFLINIFILSLTTVSVIFIRKKNI